MEHAPRVMLAIAAAIALTAGSGGCGMSLFFPVVDESTPVPEDVDSALEPFYSQVLRWDPCGEFLCSTARAPLDWDQPSAGDIELALIRQPAEEEKAGSLLLNPGGPGVSGYDFVASSIDVAVTEAVQDRYDIVGFDPRGVGRSTAVSCLEPEELDDVLYGVTPGARGSNDWLTRQNELTHSLGQACLTDTGPLLAEVDTVSAAHDLDLLRAVLGEEQLDYLGYSYGAYLGTIYAGMHADKVGRLVLDGAIDPSLGDAQIALAQAQGLETALRAYLAACMPAATCPFQGTVDDGMATVRSILDAVSKQPIPSTDGRSVGADTLLVAIAAPLYTPEAWPALDTLFTAVLAGQPEFALTLVDGYYGRTPDGAYTGNLFEAYRAVRCLDYPAQNSVSVMKEQGKALTVAAPYLGPYLAYGDLSCLSWPFHSANVPAPVTATGAAPILVLGTTNDPATPYQWAVAVASQLESGILVTRQGDGHTAFNKGNACVDATVEQYLIDGVVPPADVLC
ncbi:alpha/beta hydrolase [Agromyces badenianii]|uniref:Alpha/beta hydrolase n=1 Tax=Agromyces badenianii TaxID=2080742 RepID=A0A2S0WV84_9MICO|nr:alpha/beta hydrolase [Agromyces badenianii]AWB95232.1 alpha/beta hydrolase [Agromyces badenianii]PWC03309.1 alpha/beta hydrolase [Agromyces badenianii]